MTNKEKYNQVFIENFSITEEELGVTLEYNSVSEWDSIGHMGMIASLEEVFDITLDTDDIIDFSSYDKGIEILQKYEVVI